LTNVTDISTFIFEDGEALESAFKNYYFVRENGLYVLRKGSYDIAEKFYNNYV